MAIFCTKEVIDLSGAKEVIELLANISNDGLGNPVRENTGDFTLAGTDFDLNA